MSDNGIGCARDPAEDAGPVPWESKVTLANVPCKDCKQMCIPRYEGLCSRCGWTAIRAKLAAAEERVAELEAALSVERQMNDNIDAYARASMISFDEARQRVKKAAQAGKGNKKG